MPNTPPNLMANGNIRCCRFVKLDSSDFKVVEADANEDIIGISQEGSRQVPLEDLVTTHYAAIAGDNIRIFGEGEICLLEAGEAITMGDRLKSDADGRANTIETTGTTIQKIGARALQSAAAAGEKILVQVQIYSERPALA